VTLGHLKRAPKIVRNALRDLRYGALLGGTTRTKHKQLGAFDTANSDYDDLPLLFAAAAVTPADVLVDVGCGKGRVLNWLLGEFPANRIYGIEIDQEVAMRTAKRLRPYSQVSILCGDATTLLPADGTVFYLFNPFDGSMVARFIASFLAADGGPKRRIVYYNCKFVELFRGDARFLVEEIELPGSHRSALIRLRAAA